MFYPRNSPKAVGRFLGSRARGRGRGGGEGEGEGEEGEAPKSLAFHCQVLWASDEMNERNGLASLRGADLEVCP